MRVRALRYVLVVTAISMASLACSLASLPGLGSSALLEDNFSNDSSGWGTGTDSESSVEYANGGLHMEIYKPNYFSWSNPDQETYKGVHMEVTVKNDGGERRAGFGLICNQQGLDHDYYYFAITPDGDYVIGKASLVAEDVFLTNDDDWATSDLIKPAAESYRIGADCAPGKQVLYVDGQMVDSAADADYEDGSVGLFLWSGDDAYGEVTYDDFVMTKLAQ